jgi:predicted amidophosphoribosyltransferase
MTHPELVAGHDVLLLDDIAKSGASLRACEEMLLEAGASLVQMLALGRL